MTFATISNMIDDRWSFLFYLCASGLKNIRTSVFFFNDEMFYNECFFFLFFCLLFIIFLNFPLIVNLKGEGELEENLIVYSLNRLRPIALICVVLAIVLVRFCLCRLVIFL